MKNGWLAVFLVSCVVGLLGCDKRSGSASGPVEEGSGQRTRAKLPERGQAQGRNQVFEAALQAALALESPEARDQALSAFVLEAHEAVPGLAAEAFSQLPEGGEARAATIEALAAVMSQKGMNRALQWAESLPTVQEIALARQAVGLALAETDPAVGAQVILAHYDRRSLPNEVELHALQLWVGGNAAEAIAWAEQLPHGEARHVAMQAVCEAWVKVDADAAFAWIVGADLSVRTEAIAAMADALAGIPDLVRNGLLDQAEPAIRDEIELRLDDVTGMPIETPGDEPVDEETQGRAAPDALDTDGGL